MGGERESTVPKSRTAKQGETLGRTLGKIRFHESAGEVHFHDDDNGLKVAIPTARWYRVWEDLSNGTSKKFQFIDSERNTRLLVRMQMKKNDKGKKVVHSAFIEIQSNIEYNDTFKALQKFTNG